MNFNTPNNTSRTDALTSTLIETYCKCSWALPTNKMSNINSNFPLKINPPKLLLLNPIWTYLDFSKLLGHFWASVDHGSTVKDRGLRHFPMALRQKLWQPKEKLAKWKDGNECKCQLFFSSCFLLFDLYFAKISTECSILSKLTWTIIAIFQVDFMGRMIHCACRGDKFSLLLLPLNKSHLTELIKCFLSRNTSVRSSWTAKMDHCSRVEKTGSKFVKQQKRMRFLFNSWHGLIDLHSTRCAPRVS